MLFDKLRQIEERSDAIARQLADPAIFANPAEYARLRKEHADTQEIVERFGEYREVLRRVSEARHILAEGGDRELAELAQAEVDELQKVWLLRKALSQLNPVESMELLLDKLKQTRSNKEFLAAMHSMG